MQKIKAFVTMFNRLTWAKKFCEDLADAGCEVILIDNNSDYPPLLKYYETCPFKVIRHKRNDLAWVFWTGGYNELYNDRFVIVSDSDLDISKVPKDFVNVLMNGLVSNTYGAWKAGLSIEINDLPKNKLTDMVIEHERNMWKKFDTPGFYRAQMDVGLAVYDRSHDVGPGNHPNIARWYDAVRSDRPYTMRHLDWYLTKENVTEEDLYYFRSAKYPGWGSKWMELIYNK